MNVKETRGRVSRREFINESLAGATTLAGAPWMHDTWVEIEKV